jgi:hypothetical protein
VKIQLLTPIIRHQNIRQSVINHTLNRVIHKTNGYFVYSRVKLSKKKICKIDHLIGLTKGMNNRHFAIIFIGTLANDTLNILHSLNNYCLSIYLKLTHLLISNLRPSFTFGLYSENMFTNSNQMCIGYIYKQNSKNFYNE